MKKGLAIFSSVLLLSFCGCALGTAEDPMDNTLDANTKTYVTSDGTVVMERSTVNNPEEVSGNLVKRDTAEKKVSAPEESISYEEALKLADSCDYRKLYLPTKVSDYKKFYLGTVEYNEDTYYNIGFYVEKNSVKMFVGTDILVNCCGDEILKKDWTGSYLLMETEGGQKNNSADEDFSDVVTKPQDVLFALTKTDARRFGLSESLFSYTYEIDSKLYDRKNIKCYKITPKIEYENGLVYSTPLYVTADGTNRIIIHDDTTDDYVLVQ